MKQGTLLRDQLNEFELDWAQAAVRSELIPLKKIKGKKILLIGEQDFWQRAIAWSFQAWNDERKAGVSVAAAEYVSGGAKEQRASMTGGSAAMRSQTGKNKAAAEKTKHTAAGTTEHTAADTTEHASADATEYTVADTGEYSTVHSEKKRAVGEPDQTGLRIVRSYTGTDFTPEQADFVILTGYCCREIPSSVSDTMRTLCSWAELIREVVQLPCSRILLLSDGRVYGTLDHAFEASEYEAGHTDPCAPGYEAQYLLQALESMLLSEARAQGKAYNILRTGRVYGAYTGLMEHSVTTLAKTAAKGETKTLPLSAERTSYLSIHDALTALQFVLTVCPGSKIFNAKSPDSDASDSDIAMMLYRNFPEQCRISLEWKQPGAESGILLNTQLLQKYGFVPQVTLEDGLIIQVKSLQSSGVFIFDDTYMGKLTKVQQILLGYLLEIDRICKKHGIRYFLAGGTLLGAIRHHGFIPWDDDADVMMLREDYDRFIEVAQQELPDNIFLQIPSTEKGNYNPFTKLRINNTMFATEFTGHFLNMHNGIFFDILSHDQTANHKWSQQLHLKWTMLSRSIVFNKWGNTNIKSGGAHPLICKFVDKAKYLIPMPFALWMQERALRFFQHRKTEYLYDGMGRNLKRGPFPKEWLDETVYVDFEGYQFPVPKEYDKYLTYLYGDYMQMIPVSQRRTSHSIVLTDLGEYSDYQCK